MHSIIQGFLQCTLWICHIVFGRVKRKMKREWSWNFIMNNAKTTEVFFFSLSHNVVVFSIKFVYNLTSYFIIWSRSEKMKNKIIKHIALYISSLFSTTVPNSFVLPPLFKLFSSFIVFFLFHFFFLYFIRSYFAFSFLFWYELVFPRFVFRFFDDFWQSMLSAAGIFLMI